MPNKKKSLLSKKRPGRMKPRYDRDDSVNPLISAAGGAAGYKIAGAISERGRQGRAQRYVGKRYAEFTDEAKRAGSSWGPISDESARARGAEKAFNYAGGGKPSVDAAKYDRRKKALEGGMTRKEANKFAGISRSEQGIISKRRSLRSEFNRAQTPKQTLDAAVKNRRFAMEETRASKRSRVGGGISGVALTTLAQLVAAELRKKR